MTVIDLISLFYEMFHQKGQINEIKSITFKTVIFTSFKTVFPQPIKLSPHIPCHMNFIYH